jgi:hypothetical protein
MRRERDIFVVGLFKIGSVVFDSRYFVFAFYCIKPTNS